MSQEELERAVDVFAAEHAWQWDLVNVTAAIRAAALAGDVARGLEATAGLLAAYGAALHGSRPTPNEPSTSPSARLDALRALLLGVERGVAARDLEGAQAAARALEVFLGALARGEGACLPGGMPAVRLAANRGRSCEDCVFEHRVRAPTADATPDDATDLPRPRGEAT